MNRRKQGRPLWRPRGFVPWPLGVLLLACATPVVAADEPLRPDVAAARAVHPGLAFQIDHPAYRRMMPQMPMLPGSRWTVHDFARPQPPVVTPAPAACAEPQAAPSDATDLLADGLRGWSGERIGDWSFVDGTLKSGGRVLNMISTQMAFGDVQAHVRFRMPDGPDKPYGQRRGNSGIGFMGLYELQLLDSFDNPTYPDGMAGAIYGQTPPRVNAARPPGQWQCYDIVFRAPRFAGSALLEPARITLFWNGVLVHDAQPIFGPTYHGEIRPYVAHAAEAPLWLQDHGDPTGRVEFGSFWVRRLTGDPE